MAATGSRYRSTCPCAAHKTSRTRYDPPPLTHLPLTAVPGSALTCSWVSCDAPSLPTPAQSHTQHHTASLWVLLGLVTHFTALASCCALTLLLSVLARQFNRSTTSTQSLSTCATTGTWLPASTLRTCLLQNPRWSRKGARGCARCC